LQAGFVLHHAGPADHLQIGYLSQVSQDFVLHASGEKCVFFVFAQIFKWQHSYRFFW
jgi:hypothetical protein